MRLTRFLKSGISLFCALALWNSQVRDYKLVATHILRGLSATMRRMSKAKRPPVSASNVSELNEISNFTQTYSYQS